MSTQSGALTDLQIFDLRTTPADQRERERLLEALYESLYVDNFTIPSEREDPSIWRPRLWGPASQTLPLELHVLVASSPLERPEQRFYGAHFFELYHASRCGLVTYLVVDRPYRRQGLGRRLLTEALAILQARAEAWPVEQAPIPAWAGGPADGRLRAVFAETNNPTRVEDEVMDPWQRLEAFGRLGVGVVDLPYVQPELAPGQGRCYDLLLLALPSDERRLERLSAGALLDFLGDFYRANAVEQPDQDPDFQRMARAIRDQVDREDATIPLLSVEAWRARQPGAPSTGEPPMARA
jgi:GNAT superfamily N-acetyltransferase